ncbi:hypothetical protein [Streptomyces sp. V3I7]|nr:hypothetical protein [Streptomyces sp. V3I7]MDQ0993408.1 hypothetical protein [Streptomyces sp. V3I7]
MTKLPRCTEPTSLRFFAMVRLFDEFRRTYHPSDADYEDARTSLET